MIRGTRKAPLSVIPFALLEASNRYDAMDCKIRRKEQPGGVLNSGAQIDVAQDL
jgi:hypothetical protein